MPRRRAPGPSKSRRRRSPPSAPTSASPSSSPSSSISSTPPSPTTGATDHEKIDEYTSSLTPSQQRARSRQAPRSIMVSSSTSRKSVRISSADPVEIMETPPQRLKKKQPPSVRRLPLSSVNLPNVTDSDLSDDSDQSTGSAGEEMSPATVRLASRRGRIQYTTGTTPDDAASTAAVTGTTAATAANNDNDRSAMAPPEAMNMTPIIRRRRRIGRAFTAGASIGWNETYLTSPVSAGDEGDDANEFPSLDDIDIDRDNIGIPMLGLDDNSSLPPPRQELRRRRGANVDKQSSTVQDPTQSADVPDTKEKANKKQQMSFAAFRINYLVVHIAIMLADGLQGTHLYVLYEGYGYSVASLYCLGFVSGAITSPFIGPFVDKIGRKNSAMLYCALEMFINWLEQFPYFYGLIASRVIGGITTNLLFSVFESWLVTEHRRRGYTEDKLETILRDSVILSNLAAIASGFLAEFLAVKFGAVGPFEGAVMCTAVALLLVMSMWRENYGSDVPGVKSVRGYMAGAFKTIVDDTNISRIGLIQGLTEGSLQTFVFLWSPALARFAASAPSTAVGLDSNGEPAYGLIFGAFMACGVAGGLSEPYVRKIATYLVRDHDRRAGFRRRDTVIIEGEGEVKPAAVEFMTTAVYVGCACLLLIPYLLPADGTYSFTVSLVAFLVYEFMVGLYMPCEGVIRSIYMPTSSVCSVMTMLRVIVNIAVALGVISTNYVPFTTAFAALSTLMLISAGMQVSMVDTNEWSNFVRRVSGGHSLAPIDMKKVHFPLDRIPESFSDDVSDHDVPPQCAPVSRDASLTSSVTLAGTKHQ